MKKALLIIGIIFGCLGFANAQDVISKDGLYYKGDQLFTGKYTEFFEDGILKMEMNVVEGKEDGIVTIYFPNGKRKEHRSYKNGLREGKWLTWDENENLTAEANFKDNLKHGHWYVWDSNGQKRYDIYYEMAKRAANGLCGMKMEILPCKRNINHSEVAGRQNYWPNGQN